MEHPVHGGGEQIARELQEEEVLPAPPRDGPGLDLQEVEPLHREEGEDLVEGAALVGQVEEGADLVAPGAHLHDRGDHHEAGVVEGIVVGALHQDVQAIEPGRPAGADGGSRALAALGHLLADPAVSRVGTRRQSRWVSRKRSLCIRPCSWE